MPGALRVALPDDDRELALMLCLEMSQPLSCLLSNLSQLDRLLARSDAPEAVRAHGWLKSAFAAADQMARVLDDGRARALRDPLRAKRVDLRTVLRNAVAMTAGEAAGRARVILDAPEPLWVSGSAAQLVQAFTALLVHFAVRHPGAPRRVTLRLRRDDAAVVEIVRSAGDPAEAEPIVTPQPDAASLALGLLRARRIVAEQGGHLDLDDSGERACVRLPAAGEG
jgi:C4-dicarboxylate-specific signal transduction histidine kinase